MSDVTRDLEQVFEKVFKRPIPLRREMTAFDVEGWDSLSHINLILLIESTFNIKITAREANQMRNVGELIDLVANKKSRS